MSFVKNVRNLDSHIGETFTLVGMENKRAILANNLVILKKLNMFLHDPAMLFLVIYTRELKIFIHTKSAYRC